MIMDEKNFNMKDFIKRMIKNGNLYQKEQRILCTILLCFVLSGICLPTVKKQFAKADSKGTAVTTDLNNGVEEKADNQTKESENVYEKTEEETSEVKENPQSSAEVPSAVETEVPKDSTVNNQITPAKESSANTAFQSPSSGNSGSSASSGSTEAPATPEKVWVPPVYETVHHEAVYETVRVVICNYCGATFGSTGEFQVHKDENGG